MAQRVTIPIHLKLLLLAGIPVAGALVLGILLARDAQQQARSAEALGTIEDLARLSAAMSDTIHGLQDERAQTALDLPKATKESPQLRRVRAESDQRLGALQAFLAGRDVRSLPARLARDLGAALESLKLLEATRKQADEGQLSLAQLLERQGKATTALINATAALTQLSNDGELLRNITMLVGTLEVSERMSREQALLANVLAVGKFPPGSFRQLVTLVSEQQVYLDALRSSATDQQIREIERVLSEPVVTSIADMRKRAQEAGEDEELGTRAEDWFAAESKLLSSMRRLEGELAVKVRRVAAQKIESTRASLRMSLGLSALVLLISTVMTAWIGRGINRSIGALAMAAREVRANKDYSVRARRCSNDELGLLTDAFNEMLADISARDLELAAHRQNLEAMVAARTAELAQRNHAMRIVLDTVEQGLVTIMPDGTLANEQSSAFAGWFPNGKGRPFFDVLGPDDRSRAMMRLGWESVVEAMLPLDLCLEQMTKSVTIQGRHYALAYRPVMDGEQLLGVLLIVSDISADVERMRNEAQQREFISVFERVMKDKNGFVEFFNEASTLVDELNCKRDIDDTTLLRMLHTLKGNCSLFGIQSVAEACHRLETCAADEGTDKMREQLPLATEKWLEFARRIVPLIGGKLDDVIEVHHDELQEIITAARRVPAAATIADQLTRLKHEPTTIRFQRAAEQAKALALRLGKGAITCIIDDGDVRLPRERWSGFFQVLSHVIRNAVDHGLPSEEQNKAAGRVSSGTIAFRSRVTGGNYIIEIEDNGRGVDWQRIRERAIAKGLPATTQAELVRALFADGVSSRDVASEHSGRGVGMAAVWEAVRERFGRIDVRSEQGKGTNFIFTFPVLGNDTAPVDSRYPGARPSIKPPMNVGSA